MPGRRSLTFQCPVTSTIKPSSPLLGLCPRMKNSVYSKMPSTRHTLTLLDMSSTQAKDVLVILNSILLKARPRNSFLTAHRVQPNLNAMKTLADAIFSLCTFLQTQNPTFSTHTPSIIYRATQHSSAAARNPTPKPCHPHRPYKRPAALAKSH